jgi:hypothetical protein
MRPAPATERQSAIRRAVLGRGALESVEDDEQLHNRAIDGRGQRLHDEDIAATHVLIDLDEDIFVGEFEDLRLAERDTQFAADVFRKLRVSVAGEDGEIVHYCWPHHRYQERHRRLGAGVAPQP